MDGEFRGCSGLQNVSRSTYVTQKASQMHCRAGSCVAGRGAHISARPPSSAPVEALLAHRGLPRGPRHQPPQCPPLSPALGTSLTLSSSQEWNKVSATSASTQRSAATAASQALDKRSFNRYALGGGGKWLHVFPGVLERPSFTEAILPWNGLQLQNAGVLSKSWQARCGGGAPRSRGGGQMPPPFVLPLSPGQMGCV